MSIFLNSNGDLYSTGWHPKSIIYEDAMYWVSKIDIFDSFRNEIKSISVGSKSLLLLWSNGYSYLSKGVEEMPEWIELE